MGKRVKAEPPICMRCGKHFDGVQLLHKPVKMGNVEMIMGCVVCPNCGAAFEVKLLPPIETQPKIEVIH